MLIIQNAKNSYPIRGVPDNIPGVCYRSSSKGWMDSENWKELLSEQRIFKKPIGGKIRQLFFDNCPSHVGDDEVKSFLAQIRTNLNKLPANSTEKTQAADYFVIQKIKESWRRNWDKHRLEAVNRGLFNDLVTGDDSGRMENPGKSFYLRLAAQVIRDVNNQTESNGLNYTRKAIIRTVLSLNLTGKWEQSQLNQDLQVIIAKHRNHFNGEPLYPWDVETESDSDHDGEEKEL